MVDSELLASIAPGGILRDRYRLAELLGEGPHGCTYFAEHEFLNHPCVVKILPHRIAHSSDTAARRLRHEARTGFRVNHPNVVRVLDCDVIEGVWYFVMEYVDGVNLAAVVEAGLSIGWQQAVGISLDVAHGLAAIHRAGLVHRDIKPGNLILAASGRVSVADLGVAGLAESGPGLIGARRAEAVGTLDYAAPEVFLPDVPIGPATDLYSLGATLFQLLTGQLPHGREGGALTSLIDAQNRPVQWPAAAPAGVPGWFVEAVLRLLATDPQDRLPSPEAFVEYIKRPTAPQSAVETAPEADEALEPRGVAVLPLRNESAVAADDWLGLAVAEYLVRALSQLPGVYVAHHDELTSRLAYVAARVGGSRTAQILEAGRLVGASVIVEGAFRRQNDLVTFSAEALQAGHPEPVPIARVEGPLSKLVDLQAQLLAGVLDILHIPPHEAAPASTTGPVGPAAQEKHVLAKQAYLRGDYEVAIRLATEAIELDPDFIEPVGRIGVCYARLGRYEEAVEYHHRQEAVATQRGDMRLLAEAGANMGAMYYFKGEYETAYEHYTKAASTAERAGLTTELAQIDNNLGFALFRLGRQGEAERAFLRAIETHRAFGSLASLVGPYNGMGNVLLQQQRYKEARDYYQRALALADELGDRTQVGLSHMHLGQCDSFQGRFGEAKSEFAMALNALEETSFWNALARAYECTAEMNIRLGNGEEAARCADKRVELARLHGNRRMEAAAWRQKADALRIAGHTDEAAACFERAERATAVKPPVST
ncbi:MAG: tetratricopeptide repeat protein [Planctomycetes bacterium]|nr:tetratricopeptide repeat protein [Planctomycetota bacterium]